MSFYLSHTESEEKEILNTLGKKNVEELFGVISEKARFSGEPDLPPNLSEPELFAKLESLAKKNLSCSDVICFLGAGAYYHYIPAVVFKIIERTEFYTAYTPYQPEVSQGILQAIFEYQTMICELTGLDVSNASLYDGATALAEAAKIARNFTGRNKISVAPYLNPNYLKVLKTYGFKFTEKISDDTAAVIIQQPSFLGQIQTTEKLSALALEAHQKGALFIVVFNPISLGILEAPGHYGADIAVAEGQPLGLPLNFGGPYLGIMAAREKLLRYLPGRIVGETADSSGRRGFVLTLQTREQHIRRERATSNICSNEALCALAAAVYLSWMGPAGLRRVAELCLEKTIYAFEKLKSLQKFEVLGEAPFFNEIILKLPASATSIQKKLLKKKILAGFNLGKIYPEFKNCLLLAFTEMNTFEQIDFLVEALANV